MACRCCPGGISRSTRMPRYPPDMSDAEWAVTEPALPAPAWKQGRGGRADRADHRSGIQDRDAAKPLLWNMRRAFPAVRLSWADGGYAGRLVTWATKALKLTVQIVRRPDDLHTSQVLPRRWVVERTLAWITRCRRTVRDDERLTEHHETIVYWAMIITMSRRLARSQQPAQPRAA